MTATPLPDLAPPAPPAPRRSRRRTALLGAGVATALLGTTAPAGAETYLTGNCSYSHTDTLGVVRWRTFQARINGTIEQGTGRYVWSSYDYRYTAEVGLDFGPSSDERVTVTEGYVNGLVNPWQSPDSHGTNGDWLPEPNWKGVRSRWGWTRVEFRAAFDIPRTPDPHCTTRTARV